MDIAMILWLMAEKVQPYKYYGSLTDNSKEAFDKIIWKDDRNKPSWTDVQAYEKTAKDYIAKEKLISNPSAEKVAKLESRVAALEAIINLLPNTKGG